MATYTFTNLQAFTSAFRNDMRNRDKRLQTAVKKAAQGTKTILVNTLVPRAFGELADSIHLDFSKPGSVQIIADAPHAQSVEVGSRPHVVPLDALIRWVKQRGMQGITKAGHIRSNPTGNPNRQTARVIAMALKSRRQGNATPVDAPTIIAKAIQRNIAKYGTRPHRYMFQAVEPAENLLAYFVAVALPDR